MPLYRERKPSPSTVWNDISNSHMNETLLSLLNRLCRSHVSESWNRLGELYAPPETFSGADTVEARGDLTAAGAIMGTPDYVSPEQADDARGRHS